jgi:MerR family transcriptional regulator, copper efflux regulator
MYIGRLAKLSGATPKAIRLYESTGLIPVANRRGKYRIYTNKDLVLVHMIRRGQAVGFSLDEMKTLIEQKAQTDRFALDVANRLIAKKREFLRNEVERIMSLNRQLEELHEEVNRTFG